MDSKPLAGAKVIYDRHGDDTLTIVTTLSDAIAIGTTAGTYDVRVLYPGYADWLTANIVVAANGCQPQTVGMMVFMQPLPNR